MAIDLTCPQCEARLTLDFAKHSAHCEQCGYSRSSLTLLHDKAEEIRAKGPREHVKITHRGDVSSHAASFFRSGHDHLSEGDEAKAIEYFHRALEVQMDFTDAHLWIAKLSDDHDVQRSHLGIVLAHDSTNSQALQMLMVLNGRLTPEESRRTQHHDDVLIKYAQGPVSAGTTALLCPVCGGDLTVDDESNHVTCKFCGYKAQRGISHSGAADSLTMALMERKANPVRWIVGERLLHCNECGAERIIAGNKLSTFCPFCGSNHVIEQDALQSFEQPDALIPFRISRAEAGENIKKQLGGFGEKLRGLFDNNKIANARLNGFFLPYWVFDVVLDVTVTTTAKSSSRRIFAALPLSQSNSFVDAVYNLSICAVKSPGPELTGKLDDYDMTDAIDYDPKLLAKYPAELYAIDFDDASLEALSIATRRVRDKHRRVSRRDSETEINVSALIKHMDFRLVLMPVWVATLVEKDRDLRPALVNGQSGNVVLGKARKRPA